MRNGGTIKKGALLGYGRTAEIFTWGDDQIVKLFHENWNVAAVEEEARIGRLVQDLGLPVPGVLGTVEVEGRHGVLYERVDGPTMLQKFSAAPWSLYSLPLVLGELHASMHKHRVSELPSQREKMIVAVENAVPAPTVMKEHALKLIDRLPDDDFLCHGDFHPDQVIMSKGGPVIIDWIDAAKGSPAADVARSSLALRHLAPPSGRAREWLIGLARAYAHFSYLKRYLNRSSITRQEVDEWRLPVAVALLGSTTPEESIGLIALIEGLMQREPG